MNGVFSMFARVAGYTKRNNVTPMLSFISFVMMPMCSIAAAFNAFMRGRRKNLPLGYCILNRASGQDLFPVDYSLPGMRNFGDRSSPLGFRIRRTACDSFFGAAIAVNRLFVAPTFAILSVVRSEAFFASWPMLRALATKAFDRKRTFASTAYLGRLILNHESSFLRKGDVGQSFVSVEIANKARFII